MFASINGRRARKGTAVVAALALVVLAAALLASAAAVASAGAREVLAGRAALCAEAEMRRQLAGTLGHWLTSYDSLPIGQSLDRVSSVGHAPDTQELPTTARVSVQRLGRALFAITADVQVGMERSLARRRARLLVQRAAASDSARPVLPPAPLARWSTADLY